MPYSFTKIEKDKTKIIGFVFSFLITFYLLVFWLIALLIRNFIGHEYNNGFTNSFFFFSFSDSILILGIAFLAGYIHWTLSTNNLIEKISHAINAEPLNKNDSYHQKLQNIIDEVCVATGGARIEGMVIPTSAMNAFAIMDFKGRAVIGVTEGLLARLTRAQLEAVAGHEAAHILTGDCLSTTVTTSLFALYGGVLKGIECVLQKSRSSSRRGGGNFIILLLCIYILVWITKGISQLTRMFISRQREYRADAIAVRLTRDPLSLAQALYSISYRWRGQDLPAQEMDAIFIINPAYSAIDEAIGLFSNLFSTHPPINQRLQILLDMAHTDIKLLKEALEQTTPSNQAEISTLGDSAFTCPKCSHMLNRFYYEGIEVHKCTLCQGTLVHEENMSKIIIRQGIQFTDNIVRIAQIIAAQPFDISGNVIKRDPQTLIPCPKCQHSKARMLRMFYTEAYHVEIDKCLLCGIIWFDKDELEILQYLIEKQTEKSA